MRRKGGSGTSISYTNKDNQHPPELGGGMMEYTNAMIRTSITFVLLAVLVTPFMTSANEQNASLEEVIRAEIQKDERAAGIPDAQLEAMVAALAEAARTQGVTASDILWRPAAATEETPVECGWLCKINSVFGFSGTDYSIPISLTLLSGILILFMAAMFHRHHTHGVEPTIEAIHSYPRIKQ